LLLLSHSSLSPCAFFFTTFKNLHVKRAKFGIGEAGRASTVVAAGPPSVIKVDPPVLFPFAFPVSRGALVAIKSEEPSPSLSCHANLVNSFLRSCPRTSPNGLPNVDSDTALDAFIEDELTGNNMNQDECIDESELMGNVMNQDECIDELTPGESNGNAATTVTIMKVERPSLANVDILGLNSTADGVAASNIQQILANAKTTAGIAEAAKLVNDAKKAQKMAEADLIKEKKKVVATEKKSATLKKKQKKIEEKKAAQLLKVAGKEKDKGSKKSNSIPPAKKHKVAASNNDKVATEKKDDIEEVESETDVEECKNALYHSMHSEGYYLREENGGFSHVCGKKCIDCQCVVVSRRPEPAATENVVWPSATVPVWVCAGCKGRLLCDACFQPKKAAYDRSNPGRQPRRNR
jgi:hypothetical protein